MLVDTDVLIWYLRGHEEAARFLDSLQELKLSAVTWMELVQGSASTAIARTLTLSSANSKHFRQIPGLVLQAFEP